MIEALMALAMSAAGSLSLLAWHQHLQIDREALQQQVFALDLAQDALELMQMSGQVNPPGLPLQRQDEQGIAYAPRVSTVPGELPSHVRPTEAQLRVSWQDRQGRPGSLQIPTMAHARPQALEALLAWRARQALASSPIDQLPSAEP